MRRSASRSYTGEMSVGSQELRTLRETREGLDDQIDRLEWAITHGMRHGTPMLATGSVSDDDDDADEELLEVTAATTDVRQLVVAVQALPGWIKAERGLQGCSVMKSANALLNPGRVKCWPGHAADTTVCLPSVCAGSGKSEAAAGRGAGVAPTAAAAASRALP